MKKRELIAKMQDEINEMNHQINHLLNKKAPFNYVYKLEQDMIRSDQNILARIIKLEKTPACSCVQAHAMPEADIVCNSHNQANKQNDDYKDRCDVDKAFGEWKSNNYPQVSTDVLTERRWLNFAVYFAERVKGGKL